MSDTTLDLLERIAQQLIESSKNQLALALEVKALEARVKKLEGKPAAAYDPDWVMLPETWQFHFGFEIVDPDGWRSQVGGKPFLGAQHWDVCIDEFEFLRRASVSTIKNLDRFPHARLIELTEQEAQADGREND